ncbi:CBS domain-containing protein [Maridesulfovibrio ferrireducens]|uniref:CBS domain-containing protein n=1 Tax=Maridesulfovibrio ferrireducens TaxID=246191 RepID=UPI001A2BA8D1|nr:CBS domain-containing protein [Maridesulfovibrio ferrireducens]MBI9111823.1 CBS domain-containing protein [Maridesulfovibrio ferrireducens]
MENFRVKDLMIPVKEYSRIKKSTTVSQAMLKLVKEGTDKNLPHPHRDLLVEDETGKIIGKVTILDIFSHMEPAYFKVLEKNPKAFLDKSYVQKVFKDFNLWSEPLKNLCRNISKVKIEDIMYTPNQNEFISEEDNLDKPLHAYITGIHQPILVQKDGEVTGVLRLGDVFEKVRDSILSCEIATTDKIKE